MSSLLIDPNDSPVKQPYDKYWGAVGHVIKLMWYAPDNLIAKIPGIGGSADERARKAIDATESVEVQQARWFHDARAGFKGSQAAQLYGQLFGTQVSSPGALAPHGMAVGQASVNADASVYMRELVEKYEKSNGNEKQMIEYLKQLVDKVQHNRV